MGWRAPQSAESPQEFQSDVSRWAWIGAPYAELLEDADNLPALSIGLPAEIKARRGQYEHYRDRLLSLAEATRP